MSDSIKVTSIDYKKANNQMIEKNISEMENYNSVSEQFFNDTRDKYDKQINELNETLRKKNFKEYVDLQAYALSLRQSLASSISYYMQKLSQANSNLNKSKGDRIEYYMTGYGMKVSDATRTKLIDRDFAERERTKQLLEIHIEYLRESIKSCDNIGYAIKNLVSLMTYVSLE